MIRILVAEEHAVVLEGLKQVVAANQDMIVAGEARSGQEVLAEISKSHYDAVVLDISIPGKSWLDVLKESRSRRPNLPVLIFSGYPNEEHAMRALRSGASGYLTTECAPDELTTALRKVLLGGKYVSTSLAERFAFILEKGLEKLPHELLSDREYQVMCLIASGKTVSEIADQMSLSIKTISTYRSRVLEKLNLKNNAELALYYSKYCITKTVQCRNCGQDTPQEAKFCAYCGTALVAPAEPTSAASGPPSEPLELRVGHMGFWRKYKWFITAFLAVVVVAGLIGWWAQRTSVPTFVPTGMELKYDDGTSEAVVSSDRGGYLITFSPPYTPFAINRIRMCGLLFGSGWEETKFEVQIWGEEQEVLYSARHPFTLFPPLMSGKQIREAPQWVDVSVPDIEVKSDFSIHLYTGMGKQEGVQLGADNSVRNRHSNLTTRTPEGTYEVRDGWAYLQGMWFADKDKVNWMIRVVGRSLE
ncbi:response regulator [Chloroflexota bacterium]